ncbi:MAG: hypothetical protein CVV20_00300, partial [Gemmatimonadetes bacterium HGW-Gemmatimonadetes-1]
MTRLHVLGSGSKGNAFALEHEGRLLILEAGFSLREIDRRLDRAGLDPARVDGVAVTHEHGDHLDIELIKDLKKAETLLFCNENSASKVSWGMVMLAGDRQEIDNIIIEAVPAYN